ncbi:hypothetical protein [Inhella crocodyli]|uniref:Uncharacterized protein n=1 Tax=Inhella crocodyli TaxID=2499851 RepID=A0A437LHP9_9BURK|nr:hypothetical protein [Inhella crocodyli]RVT84905.1 hypothetical protein EOD73_12340 [Inhella crocodyli]
MKLHPSEIAFLLDLAAAKASWKAAAAAGISNPSAVWIENANAWSKLSECLKQAGATENFVEVVSELMSGLLHSVLVSLDGGTSLAETTLISLRDEEGHEFKRFLHEFWPEYAERTSSREESGH